MSMSSRPLRDSKPDPERVRRGRAARRRGAKTEIKAAEWYEERGYVVARNTHGAFDFMAAKDGVLLVVEVKGTKRPFDSYPPRDRMATLDEADKAGAGAELCHWPKRAREPTIIEAGLWPAIKYTP
jgi:hypothetical protein